MKKSILILILISLSISCTRKKEKNEVIPITIELNNVMPFTSIGLNDMSNFDDVSKNWQVVGSVFVDRNKDKTLTANDGTGILANLPDDQNNGNLFTNFKHGDIELELDVMMPKGSNSGLYFQGRYEVQLLDSWDVKEPKHSDIGGIYHRWDDSRGVGNEGYEGSAPKLNAAKAPGLWQHFKIIFHAPKFDGSGKKIKNAMFEEVWLNGVLVQKNVEVNGPTRASAFNDEQPEGSLMIQGDHGPVAFKNIQYKLYGDKKVTLTDISMKEFENESATIPNLNNLALVREIKSDSISATMYSKNQTPLLLSYSGNLIIPEDGDYRFDYRVNNAGGALIIENDTIVNLNGLYTMDSIGIAKINLKKGKIPFQLIYNKYIYWKQGFVLNVEGPGIQNQPLHAPNSLQLRHIDTQEMLLVDASDEVVLQRAFWMFKGDKRTHCIAIGTPEGIHYAYDLSSGALLNVWSGNFFNAAKMWIDRGEKQLGEPASFTVSFHGYPEFAVLTDKNTSWPKHIEEINDFKAMGYELDENGLPTFNYQNGNTTIMDKMIPSDSTRSLNRVISLKGNTSLSHKVAEGSKIEQLPDGTYIVNDESYFINFPDESNLKPFVRKINGNDELLINISEGEQTINYTITW